MTRRVGLKRSLFNPDKIATAISQNLHRDLTSATQMYGGINELQRFFLGVQRDACLKKYAPVVSDEDRLQEEAFSSFLKTNERIGLFNRQFREPRDLPAKHLTPIELTLKRARALVHWVLGDVTWEEVANNSTHSSGVTKGVKFNDTSIEAKFLWPISTTAGAAALFDIYLSDDKQLSDAMVKYNRSRTPLEMRYEMTTASRATTVPKTAAKRRMIAIEPTLNMFFQQGLMRIMYKRLAKVNLDVQRLPDYHRELAWRGSVSGNLATIDFSSASDCVSLSLARYLLPNKWMWYLDRVRCPEMEISGETVQLNMLSTMGNAGTFPLETLIFWSIGVATVMSLDRSNPNSLLSLPEERELVSVFGDDCILPTRYAESFMDNCVALGFVVNKEKSFFHDGPGFRESCGGDFLRGSYVRPLSIKAPTSTRLSALEPWLYTILNGVLPLYISYFGSQTYVYEKALLEYLFGLFRQYKLKVKLVPPDFPEDSGLRCADWRRLQQCYNISYDTVAFSNTGLATFRFCKFQYTETNATDPDLRYWLWLKFPHVSTWWSPMLEPSEDFFIRRRGGYVVARSLSPSWEL